MRVHRVDIDPTKPLKDEPGTGHNRWHEAIPPIIEVDPGDVVVLGTRAGLDGQVEATSVSADIPSFDRTRVHPLTGPVAVRGAEPGDRLHIEVLAVTPDPWEHRGFTVCSPNIGFLDPAQAGTLLVQWDLHGTAYADSPQLPGVRIPAAPFPGTLGVAPSTEMRIEATRRERGFLAPEPAGAVPADEAVAGEGLRTLPPRRNGGNLDSKLLTAGATLSLPVLVHGALVSVGDVHYAQGDGEVCGTAIEMHSLVHLRFAVEHGGAGSGGATIQRRSPAASLGEQRPFFSTTGIAPRSGPSGEEGIAAAVAEALERMMEHLMDRGFGRDQAYALCSVAVDLRITQLVNVPTVGATAVLPLDIFV